MLLSLFTPVLLALSAVPGSAYTPLSDSTLKSLPGPGKDFDIKNGKLLAPILRPRVSGTEGNRAVLKHFVDFFKNELPEWTLTFHNSTSKTPVSNGKEVPFVNLIATRDPPGTREGDAGRLAMVAHYDSKLTPEGFIGATDSAAPCAMLMHMARSVDAALTKMWNKKKATGELDVEMKGVQILLLDGEEAFKSWTDDDSLYGARALASDWEFTYHPAMSTYKTPLDSIELFLLLDLLGAPEPRVPSYFKTTHWAYQKMAKIEERLRSLGLFKSSPNHAAKVAKRAARLARQAAKKNAISKVKKNTNNAKSPQEEAARKRKEPLFLHNSAETQFFMGGGVQDDHVPFMQRGVDVLHMIPSPFPRVWHEMEDDGEHLDMDTVEDWALLVTAFAAEWMDLEGHFQTREGNGNEKRNDDAYVEKTEL